MLAPKVGPKEHIIPMEMGRSVLMPHSEYLFHCWLDPENRTKCHYPLGPKLIGGGGGLGKSMSVFSVQTPLAGPSVVFVLMHISGATTEMPNTPQPDQSFRRTYEL